MTNAYWVWSDQVSKTAPTGEYLSTGSFMVRGKKNFLPLSHLILGLSFLFKLEEGCVEKHKDERKVVTVEEDVAAITEDVDVEILVESDDELVKTEKVEKSEDSTDEDVKYPDTHIKIQHFEGTKISIVTESVAEENEGEMSENVVYLGDDKPVVINPIQRNRNNSERSRPKSVSIAPIEEQNKTQTQTKRGQKSKLKKIKEKYKDQDEEERKLRMDILKSAGVPKETKKNKKNKKGPLNKPEGKNFGFKERSILNHPKTELVNEDVDDEEPTVQTELDMINALTGQPLVDDEILFAVPVVAPYNTLMNYKYVFFRNILMSNYIVVSRFKVKLTPGTGRRGKAARTAVNMFLKDRSITPREKDLLKAVKDEQLARNLPGKVKLSAPKLQQLRK